MPFNNPKQIFVLMLSDLRQGTEKTTSIFQNLAQLAEDPDIKQALEARIFVSQTIAETLDQCFKLIDEQPIPLSGTRTRIYDVLAEDFRNEVAEIQDTKTRRFYILAKLNNLAHFRAAEYKTLIAAADVSGNYGVAALLETCLADHLAFVERTNRLIWAIAETTADQTTDTSPAHQEQLQAESNTVPQPTGRKTRTAIFDLKQGKNGQFMFNLKAGNSEVILTSELYKQKRSAIAGIDSVKANAGDDTRYERKTAKNGQPYFVLTATNGQIIGKSEMYSSTSAMENGIQSVKKNGPVAAIEDSTTEPDSRVA